ncbi:MAG TPA: PAS domain-containing protein, partial [Gaiellaceae bacterium]|nr:PAS domain-containing protein [Gaiellaceae bacterium]
MRTAVSVWTLALLLAAGALVLVATSDHSASPLVSSPLDGSVGLAFVAAGLVAWARRPDYRIGRLMILVGFTWFLGSLAYADDSTVFTIGMALGSLPYAFFLLLVLAYPSGRLEGWPAKVLAAAAFALVTFGQLAFLLFADAEALGCDDGARCPANELQVVEGEAAADGVLAVTHTLGIAVTVASGAVLLGRFRAATPAQRRLLAPVYGASGIAFALLTAAFALSWISDRLLEVLGWATTAAFLLVPLAFLYSVLERRLSRAAVSQLVLELGEGEPAGLEDALRRVLRDPTLTLARWDDEGGRYVDRLGHPLPEPEPGGPRWATPVERQGRIVAAMIHDVSLLENRELLDAVAAAAGMTIENEWRFDELQRSELRTRALLDAIPDLMFRIARDGTYLDFKAESTRDLYDLEVVGRRVAERLPGPVSDQIMRAGARALATNEVQTVEYELDFSGELRHYEGRVVASGEDEFILIVRDFTQRRRREDALERSEARTRALLDAIPDLMFRIDREGVYRGYKADDPELLILAPEEFMGRRVVDVLPPDVAAQIMSCGHRALDGGRPEPIEYELALGGVRRRFEGRVARVDDDEFLLIVRDFTERRQQEDELLALHRQLEERLGELERERDLTDRIVNSAPSILVLLDGDGAILRVNRRGVELTGYVDQDARVAGRPFWDIFVKPEDREATRRQFRLLAAAPGAGEREATWQTAVGEELVVEWGITPLPEEDGLPRVLLAAQDITHRQRQQEELSASRARIVQAADDARRRLERNLHDGAQQRLVSLSL